MTATTRSALARRSMLGALGGLFFAACGAPPPATPKPKLPPLDTADLASLVPAPGLSYVVLVEPRRIAEIPWLIPAIATVAPEENLARFSAQTGVDLRQVSQAVVARFDASFGGADLQIARHNGDAGTIEKLFQGRIVKNARRAEDRPDLVRLSGQVGAHDEALGRFGADVIAFQEGGDLERGPLRVASLYATGRLKKTPRALAVEPLRGLRARFGDAPFIALAKGPFTGEWSHAGRGLVEAATGAGAAVRPTAREHLGLAIALSGDFHGVGAAASEVLRAAWDDFASSEMGHILGLDRPIEGPLATFSDDAVALSVEIEPNRFAKGLEALLTEDLRAIMRL